MNLVDHLVKQAEASGDVPALVDKVGGVDRVQTFAELRSKVSAVGIRLRGLGLEAGDRVLVFHPVSIELYGFLLACFQVGIVAVLADPSGGRSFLDRVCGRVSPKGFFGSRKAHLLRWTTRGIRQIPIAMHPEGWWPGSRRVWEHAGCELETPLSLSAEHPALITFTSGSTGEPKGVVRTQGFLLDQHRALESALQLKPGERDLVTLPVFALANLASGLTSVIADADLGRPGEVDGTRIAAQCERWKVSRVTGAPAFFEALLRAGKLPLFEKIFTGGAPVFMDLVERIRRDRDSASVTAVYGSTEAEPVAELPSEGWTAAVRSTIESGGGLPAGRPVCELAILQDCFGSPVVGADFESLRLGAGEVGEIVVTGPQVLTGYLDGRGDEETKIHVGGRVWHRTGDAGRLDESGQLWLVGRCSARMKLGNRVVYPLAIEAALRVSFPTTKAAVVQVGGVVLAVIEGTAPDGFENSTRLLGCERVVGLKQLPMDRRHQSKIDYPGLRKLLS